MCAECDQFVAEQGEYLDHLIGTFRDAQKRHPELTAPQHAMRLSNTMIESYLLHQGEESLRQMATGFSIAIIRLIALQEINGGVL